MKSTISPERLETYAHRQAWLYNAHPPYRYHIDTIDVANILGTGWNSPWTAWNTIRTQQFDPPQLQHLNQNLLWIPIMRRLYENKTNRNVDLQWRRVRHKELQWAYASLFGMGFDNRLGTNGGIVFLISKSEDLWGSDGIELQSWTQQANQIVPPNVAMEAYWNLLCSDLDWMDIAVAFPSWSDFVEMRIIRIYPDLDMQKGIERAVSAWRENHLVQGEAPAIDSSRACTTFLMEKYRYSGDKIRKATDEEEQLLGRYNEVNQQLQDLQLEQRKLRNQLFSQIAHDKGVHCQDGSRAVISKSRKGFQVRTFQSKKSA